MGFDDMAPNAPLKRTEKLHHNPHRDLYPSRTNGYVVDGVPAEKAAAAPTRGVHHEAPGPSDGRRRAGRG